MTEERTVDLLVQRATVGLDEAEQTLLGQTKDGAGTTDDISYDLAAAAIGLIDIDTNESMPEHLFAKVRASADEFFAIPDQTAAEGLKIAGSQPDKDDDYQKLFYVEPRRSWSWLGWAAAAAACIALAINIGLTRMNGPETVIVQTPEPTPVKLTPEQELAGFMASQKDMTKAAWTVGNMKDAKSISGDVMWSDKEQKGYLRIQGLPVNDRSKETYQLWIFDKTQDPKTPINGGTFDVNSTGETIFAINTKLRAEGARMFAITMEKPGGVVVSKSNKIAALAKVETSS
jgi:hypothetical protein